MNATLPGRITLRCTPFSVVESSRDCRRVLPGGAVKSRRRTLENASTTFPPSSCLSSAGLASRMFRNARELFRAILVTDLG
ncbi:hypothetical protein D3C78_1445170 [compost metagenome]